MIIQLFLGLVLAGILFVMAGFGLLCLSAKFDKLESAPALVFIIAGVVLIVYGIDHLPL